MENRTSPPHLAPRPARLAFQGIGKSFSGIPVLRDVSFEVGPGRIVGLVGENGAGKSTLMDILGGNTRPDAGRMLLDGEEHAPRSSADAASRGIAFVHQELNLFGNLSVAENLFLGDFPVRRIAGLPVIRRRALREASREALARVGFRGDPGTPVERLPAGDRQLVEIAKALRSDARLLILDEPTTSLGAREAAALLDVIAALPRRGASVIYISHSLGDVLRLADDIVVLRDGEVVGAGPREAFDPARLVSLMVGRTIDRLYPDRAGARPAEPVLEVEGLGRAGVARDVGFSLRRGEILGLAGLMGSGRTEVARMVFGADPFDRGEVRIAGQPLGRPVRRPSPGRSIRLGLAFATESRRDDGLCLEASVAENIALVSLRRFARGPLGRLDRKALDREVEETAGAVGLDLRSRAGREARTLSGGNQQKAVLAKWLLAGPRALILDEPTRGIDVGAKVEIYRLIADLAGRGAGVLLISSEIEELIGLCDRILVMAAGEVRDRLERAEFDRERILRAALGEGGTP